MKIFTPSLIQKKRKGVSFWSAVFKKKTDSGFYRAVSHDGSITLLWIEANQFGQTNCYPCILRKGEETYVFLSGSSKREKAYNAELVEAWKQTVTPNNIDTDFYVEEMDTEPFFREFNQAEADFLAELEKNKD